MENNEMRNSEDLDSQGSQREPAAMRRGLSITEKDIRAIIKRTLEFEGPAAAKSQFDRMCSLFSACTGWAEMAKEVWDMLIVKHIKMQEQEAKANKQIINNFNGTIQHFHAEPEVYAHEKEENVEGEGATKSKEVELTDLITCANRVSQYFWSDSAMAVIFCVCRDCYDYEDNMSRFERDFQCKTGLVASTFRNNPYMRLHIDKWKQHGAKPRVLHLIDAYQAAVTEVLST